MTLRTESDLANWHDRTRVVQKRSFWISLVLAFAVLLGWSLASPDMASPDEPAHAAKAAATVRGQFFADESRYNPGRGEFQLPALFNDAWKLSGCFAFKPDVPAGCAPALSADRTSIQPVASHVERYNPLYYAIIGLPSLLPPSEWTFTLMRAMSALLNAVLLAFTVRVVVGLRRPALVLLGVAAALTPMTFFIGSSMTPQGPEIFGACLVTVSLLALFFQPDPNMLRGRLWSLVIGVAFFALARGLSPAYLAIILVVCILAAPRWRAVADVFRDRASWVPIGVCVFLAGAAGVYTLVSDSLALGIVFPDPTLTARDVVVKMLRNTDYYLEQILGTFGWGDTHLPAWLLNIISGIAVLIGVLGVALARWRQRLLVLFVIATAVLMPIGVQLLSFHESGLVWQGKYVMPLAMLAPLLCGFLAADSLQIRAAETAILKAGIAVVAGAQIAAITVNIHRYVSGANGPWLSPVPGAWQPFVSVALIIGVEFVAWCLIVLAARAVVSSAREYLEPAIED